MWQSNRLLFYEVYTFNRPVRLRPSIRVELVSTGISIVLKQSVRLFIKRYVMISSSLSVRSSGVLTNFRL